MVNRPAPLHRSATLDAQLRAQALAADRANTPTGLLVITGALVVAALVYLLLGGLGVHSSRAALRSDQFTATSVDRLVEQINELSTNEVDLSQIYSRIRDFNVIVAEAKRDLTPAFSQEPIIAAPRNALISPSARVHQVDVACDFRSPESLESILAWMDAILHHERLEGRAFVSRVVLNPIGMGWQGGFTVSIYEHRP